MSFDEIASGLRRLGLVSSEMESCGFIAEGLQVAALLGKWSRLG